MMTFSRSISVLILAVALSAPAATAQTNGSNSPYSRYGFGLLSDGVGAAQKGMAGTSLGMRNGTELNPRNPASYAAIDSLSFLFDVGVTFQNGNIAQGSIKTNARNTSIDYVTAGFRLAPRLGMSIGMLPYSTIGYEMSSTRTLTGGTSEITETNSYSGDGGLHTVYGGFGWEPLRRLSLGFNAGYLWGTLDHKALMSTSQSNANSTRQVYTAEIRSYKVDFGLQYQQPLNDKHALTLGVVYGLGHDIDRSAHYYNQKVVSSSVSGGDTLTARNAFALPHTLGVGLTWTYDNALSVGIDYNYERWSKVKYPTREILPDGSSTYLSSTGSFDDSHGVSLGAEYIPKSDGLRWRQRIRYRAGFSYKTSYLNLNGQKGPRHYQASLGIALPIINLHNNRSLVNISAQYERVQPRISGMVTENYFRISLGLSFNERWFMKWKAE